MNEFNYFMLLGNQERVNVKNFEKSIEYEMRKHVGHLVEKYSKPVKKVGVLISGSGTNLQALIDATKDPTQHINAEIALVISNKDNVQGLKRAEKAGIPTKVLLKFIIFYLYIFKIYIKLLTITNIYLKAFFKQIICLLKLTEA